MAVPASFLRLWVLCAVLALPVWSLPWLLDLWPSCEKTDSQRWSAQFLESIGERGLEESMGLSSLAADVRTGALSLSHKPHVYAIAGGGQWGARAVATALLDSMYETWPSKVAVLDMEEAVEVYRNSGLEEGMMWLREAVGAAITRCPSNATIVFDNAHALTGESVAVLDPLLMLFDGERTNMDYRGERIAGSGSVFLLLLNEKDTEETMKLEGKDRLLHTWNYQGPLFTTKAFVGRMDGATLLSSPPRLSHEDEKAMEDVWREAAANTKGRGSGGIGGVISTAFTEISSDSRKMQAIGATAAAILATGAAAFWVLGLFEVADPHASAQDDPLFPTGPGGPGDGNGGGDDGYTKEGRREMRARLEQVRGGGPTGAALHVAGRCASDERDSSGVCWGEDARQPGTGVSAGSPAGGAIYSETGTKPRKSSRRKGTGTHETTANNGGPRAPVARRTRSSTGSLGVPRAV